jgi:hypothetical protein
MPYVTYVKWALIAGVLAWAYHAGGNGPRAALEADHAAMAETATAALLAQRAASDAQIAKLSKVVSDYENAPPDPLAPVVAHRVLVYAASACRDPVPAADPVAGGTQTPAPVAVGPSRVEQALGELLTACAADAAQMRAMIEAAP